MKKHRRLTTLVLFPISLVLVFQLVAQESVVITPDNQNHNVAQNINLAVDRTRKTVRMLDDIYKGGIVLITTHYVTGSEDLPAGTAFKKLFESAKQKGWHEVRLLDATGDPTNDENSPADEFEEKAVAKIASGEAWYEEIVEKEGKRYLRAATPIPVVMEKCTMCHSNYDDVKAGQAIGALGYTIPIE